MNFNFNFFKTRKYLFSVPIIFSLSCNVNTELPRNTDNAYVSQATIKKGVELKDKYPDENFIFDQNATRIVFQRDNINDDSAGISVILKNESELYSVSDKIYYLDEIYSNSNLLFNHLRVIYNNNPQTLTYPYLKVFSPNSDGFFIDDNKIAKYSLYFPVSGIKADLHLETIYSDIKYFTIIPVREKFLSEERIIDFFIPDWLDLEIMEFNLDSLSFTKKEEEVTGINKKIKREKFERYRTQKLDYDPEKDIINYEKAWPKFDTSLYGKKSISVNSNPANTDTTGKFKRITYKFKNLNYSKSYQNSPSFLNSQPYLLVLAKSYRNKNGINKTLLKETKDLYAWYHSLCKDLPKPNEQLIQFTNNLIVNKNTEEEKIKTIFYWIQDNIKYLAYSNGLAGFKPESANDVFFRRFGDCKGMANLCKTMLQIAGIDARLTWIGTRDRSFTYDIPSLLVDNHMITTVYLQNGTKYFLDATEKFIPMGEYADRIQGKQVMIENGINYTIDSIPFLGYKRNQIVFKTDLELQNGELKGNMNSHISGDMKSALQYISTLIKTDLDANDYKKILNLENDNIELNSISLLNLDNRDQSIQADFAIKVINQFLSGKVSLLNLNYRTFWSDLDLSEKSIKSIDFNKAINQVEIIRFKIPANLRTNYIPDALIINNNDFKINLGYSFENEYLVLKKEFICQTGIINPTNLKAFKESLEKLKKFYNQSVVFSTK